MSPRKKWLTAALTAGVFLVPGVPGVPLSGFPATGLSAFALVVAWMALFVALPWRVNTKNDRGRDRAGNAWFWSSFGVLLGAAVLKLVGGLMAAPQGLEATYELLADDGPEALRRQAEAVVDPARATAAAPPPARVLAAWRRVDRDIQFSGEGASLLREPFYLPFDALRGPTDLTGTGAKPAAGTGTGTTGRPNNGVEAGAIRVTWRGAIHFPWRETGLYSFHPRTDGWYSIRREDAATPGPTASAAPTLHLPAPDGATAEAESPQECDTSPATPAAPAPGGVTVVGSGGPGAARFEKPQSFERGPHPVTIRYLHPLKGDPATGIPAEPMRFELRWDPPGSGEAELAWRRLYPDAEISWERVIVSRVGEGLCWGAFGLVCGLALTWLIFLVDYRALFSRFFRDRMTLCLLSLLAVFLGAVRIQMAPTASPDARVPADAAGRDFLRRALALGGGPGAPVVPGNEADARLATDAARRARRTAEVDSLPAALAVATEGLLGPVFLPPGDPRRPLTPATDAPLMEYLLAAVSAMFGGQYALAMLFQVFGATAAIWAAYGLARLCFGRAAGLIAAAAVAVDPVWVFASAELSPDLSAALAGSGAAVALMFARRVRTPHWFALAGFLAGLGYLVRPELLALPAVFAAWLLWPKYGDPRMRRRVVNTVIVAAAFLLTAVWLPTRSVQLGGPADWLPSAPSERLAALGTALSDPARFAAGFLRVWGLPATLLPGPLLSEARAAGDWTLPLRTAWLPTLYLAVAAVGAARAAVRRDSEPVLVLLAAGVCLLPAFGAAVLAVGGAGGAGDFDPRFRAAMPPLLHVFTAQLIAERFFAASSVASPAAASAPSSAASASPESPSPEPTP